MKPTSTVTTRDGWTLGLHTTVPAGRPVGEVLLLHAMLVDARSLDRPPGRGLASALAARGFRVHRADLRGRGMSRRGPPATWGYDELVTQDLPALVEGIGAPPWVVGHSLGGHVAAAAWATGAVQLRGLVGLGANTWLRSTEPSRPRRWAKRLALAALVGAARAAGRVPARALRVGSVDESARYAADLAGYWRGWSSRGGDDWLEALGRLRGAALFITSEGDRLLAHPVGAEAWARHIDGVELWRVRRGELAAGWAPDHMQLATDVRCRPLWDRVAGWMLHA